MSQPIDLSLGEFRALVSKAFRGAGYSWGLTEDAAFAAQRLAELGLPAADLVAGLLTTVDGCSPTSLLPAEPDVADSAVVCPIWVGVCLADDGPLDAAPRTIANVASPALIAPLVSTCSTQGEDAAVTVEWDGGRCDVSQRSIVLSGVLPEHPVAVRVHVSDVVVDKRTRHDRVELEHGVRTVLEDFARRTYAPATEASRLAGAGPA